MAKREPLTNIKVERERFDATLKAEMNQAETATLGVGDVDDARLTKSIAIIAEANGLPRTPNDEIFTRAFLPPKAERPMKLF